MSILSWGKPDLETTTSVNGAPADNAEWKHIDTPKKDTTKLTPTAGEEVEALEEGGEIVDFRTSKNKNTLEFDLFVKKGHSRPWEDNDGIVAGEHAIRITPEDEECEGIQIDRASIRCEESYTTADGKLLHYVCKVLKPAEGKSVKPYIKSGTTYSPVSNPTGNPKTSGYYEKVGSTYVLTTDTTVVSTKTYYKADAAS